MFAGITELTKLEGFKTVDYNTEQRKLIDEKMTQKNTEFIAVKDSIIDKFNAAIKSRNSDDLRTLLNDNDYNGTEGTDDSIDAVIGQLNTIIEVNSNIKSMKTDLTDLENERNTMINSLTALNAENENKKKELEAENAKLTKEIGELQFKKKKF